MVATSAAEIRNDAALIRKTGPAPIEDTSTPPATGPTTMPAFRPRATIPLAQLRSASSTRFGIAADDEEKNGASASADRKAHTSNIEGAWATPMATKQPAPARSDAIMTLRR